MILKKLGMRTIGFVFFLSLTIAFLLFFWISELISIYMFIILSIVAITLIVLNVIDRFRHMDEEAVKKADEGDEKFRKGEFKAAQALYEEALVFNEKSYAAHMGLGQCYKTQLNWDKAISFFKDAAKIDPTSSYSRHFMAYCCNRKGDMAQAITYYEKAISLNEDLIDAYRFLGDIHYQRGEDREAEKCYEKFLSFPLDDSLIKPVEENLAVLKERLNAKEEVS